jgi:type IX secretion system PorP/SprF family membrane protein
MLKKTGHLLLLLLYLFAEHGHSQDIDPGPGYQMVMMNNPAFSGIEGDGMLRLSYTNFLPGNNYNLHSVYLSYDSYFPVLHGGAGIYLYDEYLGGIVNNIRGGFSYAYFLQAGEDLFINAGLSGSVYHRGLNFGGAILPDQIDPLGGVSLPSGEVLSASGQTGFDIGAGFVFITRKIAGGFSVNHLAEPDFSSSGFPDEKLRRKYLLHLAGDYNISKNTNLNIRPLGYAGLQGELFYAGIGAVIESNHLSVNVIFLGDNEKQKDIQAGFTFGTGNIRFFYNYRFNIASENKLMPLSLFHQTGIAIGLNSVDKRNIIKTINLPKL